MSSIEIPYAGISMPGYFLRVDDSGFPRATVVLTGGPDGTAEELMLLSGFDALERGYNVLAFDGPGQGAMIDRGVGFRTDWESVITPVVDIALALPEVDPARLVLWGLGLGGYLALRAATREHRFAACISDRGPYALPPELAVQYSLKGRERLVTCPTLVVAAEGDELLVGELELFDALACPKTLLLFTEADGGAQARLLHHERVFAWLDATLGHPVSRPAPGR